MPDENLPNDASRKNKAEGERWESDRDEQSAGAQSGSRTTGERAGGITNRTVDEEVASQEALPERGESKPGAHAGHGDGSPPQRRTDR